MPDRYIMRGMIKVYQIEDDGVQVWYVSKKAANQAGYTDDKITVVTLKSANRAEILYAICAIHNGGGAYAVSEKPLIKE